MIGIAKVNSGAARNKTGFARIIVANTANSNSSSTTPFPSFSPNINVEKEPTRSSQNTLLKHYDIYKVRVFSKE